MSDTRTVKGDVLIPGLQSLVTGVILGLTGWALAAIAELDRPWVWGLAVGVVCMALAWLLLLRFTWTIVERVLGIDINRDGFVGEPVIIDSPPVTSIQLTEDNGNYPSGAFLDLPIDRQRMIMLSMELQGGASFGHNLAGPGKVITRSEYERLRDYLIVMGLARWNSQYSRKEGLCLTGKGRAIVKGFASMAGSNIPTLIAGDNPINPVYGRDYTVHTENTERFYERS